MVRDVAYEKPEDSTNSREAKRAAQLSEIAKRVQALRSDMEYRAELTRKIENEQQNLRRALQEMGYRGPMPWVPVKPAEKIVPFPNGITPAQEGRAEA